MERYVAFLRAINVGGHTVKMDHLRALFEKMGFDGVSTFIASGNVIFESPLDPQVLEAQIAEGLERALGYRTDTFLRSLQELRSIASHPPFTIEEVASARSAYVCLLGRSPDPATAAQLRALSTATQLLRAHGRELYWLSHTSLSESDIPPGSLERTLRMPTTMRNLNTVRRIVKKFGA